MTGDTQNKLGGAGERTVILRDESLRKLNGFIQIPKVVLTHQKLSYGAKVAYGVLLGYAWQEDFCYPAQEAIARDLNCSTRQARRLLTELRDKKLVSWKQRGLNKPNIYSVLPITNEKVAKTLDRTNMSTPDRTDMSALDRTNMSDKVYPNGIYSKPLTVKNGDLKISKSNLKKLPVLDQPKEKTQYIAEEILKQLGDKHSEKFYYLVASRVPEQIIRKALSEIKADGARNPASVFTYRMKLHATTHLKTSTLTNSLYNEP